MGEDGKRSWPRPLSAGAFTAMVGLAACILPDVDLEGRPCPCTEGYSCDAATDTCVKGEGSASSAATGVTASSSQGEGPSTTVSSASESSAGGGGQGGEGIGGSGGGPGTGGNGSTVSSSTGSGGEGGQGGSGGCEDGQTSSVPSCGTLSEVFDDPGQFDTSFSLSGPASAFEVANSQLTITMSTQATLVAYADETIDLVGCGVTVRLITPPDAPDILGRLSIGPDGGSSRFSIGVIEGTLQARDADTVVVAMDYDPVTAAYLRIREEAGTLYYGTSADGICWDDVGDVQSDETIGVTGRLVLISDDAPAPATVVFDDYNFLP